MKFLWTQYNPALNPELIIKQEEEFFIKTVSNKGNVIQYQFAYLYFVYLLKHLNTGLKIEVAWMMRVTVWMILTVLAAALK